MVELPGQGDPPGARVGENLSREGRWSLSGRHDLYRRGPRPAGEGLQTGDHVDGRLTSLIVSPADPGEEGEMEEDAVPTTA